MAYCRHTLVDIITEIKSALNDGHYILALNTALIIPDICGEIAYPEYLNRRAGKAIMYTKWINRYIPLNLDKYYKLKENESWGAVLYTVRNNLLHDLSNLKGRKINNINFRTLKFIVGSGDYESEVLGIFDYDKSKDGGLIVDLEINIKCLCLRICEATEQFCNEFDLNMSDLAAIDIVNFD